ncbi:uncharacterized protein LOC118203922 isoform X3 [Stegodyphus dumicola]|uniref:uncharacterized protein LOC118203922 isoform X3 n=1 Tax=Stegodyphus dumicola TaxID=202533 RepID=UPI0015B17B12|nr:uncharacterized protein LOC118203922 isoform X3 [Stegodyphus dumicola]
MKLYLTGILPLYPSHITKSGTIVDFMSFPGESVSDGHSSSSSKSHDKKWDHSGFYELYPGESISDGHSSSSSKSRDKKQKKKKRKRHTKCSSADKEIWEEFKLFRRSKMEKQKAKSKESLASISSRFDNHVKEWRKHTDAVQLNS